MRIILQCRQIVLVVFCLMGTPVSAAISSFPLPPGTSYLNWMNVGASVGAIGPRDATFWGWTADYTRVWSDSWSSTFALAFDRETEKFDNKPDKQADTYTFIATTNYALGERWSVSTGIAKGLFDDDNPDGRVKFNWGDWSTGIAAGYSLTERLGLSFAWEYNLSQNEPSVSIDIGYRWGF